MKNYWLDKKKEQDFIPTYLGGPIEIDISNIPSIIFIDMPEIPAIPPFTMTECPPPDINLPPIIFTCEKIPSEIKVDWGTPPKCTCTITVPCPSGMPKPTRASVSETIEGLLDDVMILYHLK